MDAAFVCGCIILWCCIYIADTWTEECESGGSIADFKPGIRLFRTGGLADIAADLNRQRKGRLLSDFLRRDSGAASGEKETPGYGFIRIADKTAIILCIMTSQITHDIIGA